MTFHVIPTELPATEESGMSHGWYFTQTDNRNPKEREERKEKRGV